MGSLKRTLAAAFGTGLLFASAPAKAQTWVAAWAFPPSSTAGPASPPSAPNPNDPRGPLGPSEVENATVVQTVQVTASGDRVRLRLSNAHGADPIRVGAVTISGRPATLEGRGGFLLQPGVTLVTDPIDLPVRALERLEVRVFYPERTRLPTHRWRQILQDADGRNSGPQRLGVLLSAVEVETRSPPGVIVAFGDSITEGTGALPDGPGGWPPRLAARMVEAGRPWAVVNAGIGGNRLLFQGSGPSGLERLDGDALTMSGARCLILLEGINDIGRPSRPAYAHQAISADDLIAGYRQVLTRARAMRLKVVLATLPPFEGADYFTPEAELLRQAANAWIRTSGEVDAVVDFDAAVRDPQAPARFRPEFQSGDWLHPSDAGYQAMAEAVPLDACD